MLIIGSRVHETRIMHKVRSGISSEIVNFSISAVCVFYNSSTQSTRKQNYFPSTKAMGAPHRNAKGSHDNHDNFDGWPYPLQHSPNHTTINKWSSTLKKSTAAKSRVCCINNASFTTSTVLAQSVLGLFNKLLPMPSLTSLPTMMTNTQTRLSAMILHFIPPFYKNGKNSITVC